MNVILGLLAIDIMGIAESNAAKVFVRMDSNKPRKKEMY